MKAVKVEAAERPKPPKMFAGRPWGDTDDCTDPHVLAVWRVMPLAQRAELQASGKLEEFIKGVLDNGGRWPGEPPERTADEIARMQADGAEGRRLAGIRDGMSPQAWAEWERKARNLFTQRETYIESGVTALVDACEAKLRAMGALPPLSAAATAGRR